ncbi:MAG: P-loop NTPase [Verrucomicrobia bacterium]|nr:P-loop NTPase [Verrucomicrobiota bacterium]
MPDTYTTFRDKLKQAAATASTQRPLWMIHTVNGGLAVYLPGADETAVNEASNSLRSAELVSPWIERVEGLETDSLLGKEVKRLLDDSDDSDVRFGIAHLDKLNWFFRGQKYELPNKTPIVCFYSFKGGVGRTTTAALTALSLARIGQRVAVLDFDFEAPGLATLFSEDSEETSGVLDFIQPRLQNLPPLDIHDYYFRIQKSSLTGTQGGEVFVFPAAKMEGAEADYLDLLSRVYLAVNTKRTARMDLLLETIEHELKPDIILIDSRTGFNDIAGLLLGRYSQHAVMFFLGSPQNMFGLEATLPHFRAQDVSLTMVHSPVPSLAELAKEARDVFLDRSWEAFSKHVYPYLGGNIPDLNDATAPHYPIEISWTEDAILLTPLRLEALLNSVRSSYSALADRLSILTLKQQSSQANIPLTKDLNANEALNALSDIVGGKVVGDSVGEFSSPEKLKQNFFPLKDYKFIFTPRTFLVLGGKGSGKSALSAALTASGDFYKGLREYCGGTDQQEGGWHFYQGMAAGTGFPDKQAFRALNDATPASIETYWLLLLIRRLVDSRPDLNGSLHEKLHPILDAPFSQLPTIANDSQIGAIGMEWLHGQDLILTKTKEQVFMVYDYLDSEVPSDGGLRGRVVGALLSLWHGLTERFTSLRAKIFLRQDIFDREVGDGITDKAKLKNFAVNLEWTYEQLLNLVWKRWIARSENVQKAFFPDFKESLDCRFVSQFGPIPVLTEEQSAQVLNQLFGPRMGANNQAKPINWVKIHLSDANGRLAPRAILTLFSKVAALQREADATLPIKSSHLDQAGAEVSTTSASDLREEYPELVPFLEKLKDLKRFPRAEKEVREALETASSTLHVGAAIQRLQDIGVFFPYKTATKKGEQRLHIPDVYLYGLGLERTGPGAQKAVVKRKR